MSIVEGDVSIGNVLAVVEVLEVVVVIAWDLYSIQEKMERRTEYF